MSSIALATPLPVSLGDTVTFDTVFDGHGHPTLRVQVLAYQDDELVYGEAGDPGHEFVLGGASSFWLANGGPAHCHADLYYFSHQGNHPTTVILASCDFEAV